MEPDQQQLFDQAFRKDHEGKRHLVDADALAALLEPLVLGRKGGEAKPNEPKEDPKKKEK
jgi:hypothetical protein